MNRALMNQNTLPIIGSGPLASAPVASAGNLSGMYLETGDPLWPNGRLWRYRRGFNNDGTDAIVIRNSTLIRDKIRPKVDSFTFEIIFNLRSLNAWQNIVTLLGTDAQLLILVTNLNKIRIVVGGVVVGSDSVASLTIGKFYRCVVSVNADGTTKCFINSVEFVTGTCGAVVEPSALITLSAKNTTSTDNHNGYLCCFGIYYGYSSIGNTSVLTRFSSFALDEIAGSTTVSDSLTGVLGDITDGSPTGAIGTPMLVPIQW